MKRVLIATTNNDKYDAVSKIFSKTIFPKEEYKLEKMTDDMHIPDEKEVGNNVERARKKAFLAYEALKDYDYDYIVGLDDAIRIKGRLEPNIKEFVSKILYENYLDDGEEYAFNRAYAIYDKDGNIYETTAEIPYIYHPLKGEYKLESFTYPLSRVAYPVGSDRAICDISGDEEINYYLKYVKDKIENIGII